MRAAVIHQINQPLQVEELLDPEARAGQSIAELQFAALNHRDVWISKGKYAGIRLPLVPGSDGSGEVNGKKVLFNPSFNWGADERFQDKNYKILGLPDQGTLATKLAIDLNNTHSVPSHLTMQEAAALPLAGLTAYRALFVRANVQAGETVFISGVGGGVATFAFQMAMAIGCRVVVSSGSEWKRKKAVEAGAWNAYDYNDPEYSKKVLNDTGGIQVIIDSAAGPGFGHFLRMAAPGGRICIYGGSLGELGGISPQLLFWKQLSILGSTMGSANDFDRMMQFVTNYQLRPIVDRIFPLSEINDAFQYMSEGAQFGKIVIDLHS
jgi:zinc-binding alcohol dehydrogenase/oxidoreductase